MKDNATIKRPEELTDDEIINALSGVDIPAEDIEITPLKVSINYPYHPAGGARDNEFEKALFMGVVLKDFFVKNSEPLRQRIAELEAENARLKDLLNGWESQGQELGAKLPPKHPVWQKNEGLVRTSKVVFDYIAYLESLFHFV